MLNNVMHKNRLFVLALAVIAALGVWAGCKSSSPPPPPAPTASAAPQGLKPGPNDPRIAYVAARLLEEFHYLQKPLDRDLSMKFYDEYVDSLDPRHETFLQSDLDEFAPIRTNLDILTVGSRNVSEIRPAFAIYERFVQRAQEHYDYVNELLRQDKFKFNADEKFVLDRRHEPFPKDLDEAKQIWRQEVRYEYLTEKLSDEISETNGVFTIKKDTSAFTNIVAALLKRHRLAERYITNADSDAVLQAYLNALAHAYDPHSDYFGAPKAQDFSIDMSLSLFGIGAQLADDDGYCTIEELVPGGPAMKSKDIKPKDRILAVAQSNSPPVDAVNLELEKVVQMIRGPKGTEVRLTISPAEDRSARKIVTLVRDEIKLEDKEAKADLIVYPDGKKLGIIDLPSFYATVDLPGGDGHSTPKYTSADVARLVKKLKSEKVDGIILDLRSNPGGSLEEAVKFTGLFIKEGPVVLARESTGQVVVESDPDPEQLYSGPLVVMLNRFSASASEIAAAALQDYGRALIVGDSSTHGKGTVQKLEPLRPYVWPANATATNDPGTLKITKGKFYRVTGASTQLKGVISDIVLPDELSYSTMIGESSLNNALPWDTIQAVDYQKFNMVQPYLAELQSRSQARLATNQDYIYIKQDIDDFLKLQADKTVTLNEHEAISERETNTLRAEARDKERNTRPAPDVKIYDLTVENADESGLPAPLGSTNDVAAATSGGLSQTNSLTSTNSVAAAATPKKFTPPLDPTLDETERIMLDYISLMHKTKDNTQIANQSRL